MDVLLNRLCDLQADVVFFPVRHHSPAAAALLAELIDAVRPAALLVEGPSDYNPHLRELQLDHTLPLAIYSYFRDAAGQPRGAYYPFSDFSPEWVAIRRAHRVGAAIEFIDLPWIEIADLDRTTHRYADAELRSSRYVAELCRRLGVEDFDDLWDKLIESHVRLDLADYLRRVHSLCYHIRLWEGEVFEADRRREAFMAQRIRAWHRSLNLPSPRVGEGGERSEPGEGDLRGRQAGTKGRPSPPTPLPQGERGVSSRLLVVTGGFHSSALAARLDGLPCPGIDDPPPRASEPESPLDRGIALSAYSYLRLDSLTGYEAGMPSPGFYDHTWRQRQRGEPFSHAPLLKALVRELRRKKQVASTADLIAIEMAARALAALRGRPHVWRRDLIDAVTSALIKDELEYGCESPFLDAVHAILRGSRRGRLAEGTRLPPLVADIRNRITEADLDPARGVREVELNLLDPVGRERSRLLHRLAVLDIAGYQQTGGTDFLERRDLTRLWESWRIAWSPELDGTCIEASRYGTTLAEAAANRLVERAGGADRNTARTSALLIEAAQAGIEAISADLIAEIERRIGEESEFADAAKALGHLLFLYCYDEAFGTANVPRIGALVAEALGRSLWLLESLGQSTAPAAPLVAGMQAMLETYERAEGRIEIDRDEFAAVLQRVERDSGKPPQVHGAAAGMLWAIGQASPDRVLADMLLLADPEHLGDFLAGLFALAREVAQRHPKLVEAIDCLLMEFSAEEFQQTLPALRLAFTYFTPREKHYMLTTLFEALGLKQVEPQAALAVDPDIAAAALVLEERLFGMLKKYGLETGP